MLPLNRASARERRWTEPLFVLAVIGRLKQVLSFFNSFSQQTSTEQHSLLSHSCFFSFPSPQGRKRSPIPSFFPPQQQPTGLADRGEANAAGQPELPQHRQLGQRQHQRHRQRRRRRQRRGERRGPALRRGNPPR